MYKVTDIQNKILAYCQIPRTKIEIMEFCGYKDAKNFVKMYIKPLLDTDKLEMTISDKPRSRNQRYIIKQQNMLLN